MKHFVNLSWYVNLKKSIDDNNSTKIFFMRDNILCERKVRIGWRNSGYTYFICPTCLSGSHSQLIFVGYSQKLRCVDCLTKKQIHDDKLEDEDYWITRDMVIRAGEIGDFDLLDDLIDGGVNLSDYF